MDRELEEQIDDLIHKATKDLKTRIVRIVVRHQNKLLKDQARELKAGTSIAGTGGSRGGRKTTEPVTSGGRVSNSKVTSRKSSSKKDSKYHSDSDSDGYYSE
jgi:hypothetical protein